ncbi:Fic family protein [Candidatus Poriferisodalis sp.]|uniref:Fic family protein n=1 Tax=Candidatus Poriferisodalis sp. TaxID=3101277 RepID=UPI003B0141C7
MGGSSPFRATYVPSAPDEIADFSDDLIAFANERTDLDSNSHAAVLHAQFEAIHLYGDGNGRLGRILVTGALRRAGLTRHSTVPISSPTASRLM